MKKKELIEKEETVQNNYFRTFCFWAKKNLEERCANFFFQKKKRGVGQREQNNTQKEKRKTKEEERNDKKITKNRKYRNKWKVQTMKRKKCENEKNQNLQKVRRDRANT